MTVAKKVILGFIGIVYVAERFKTTVEIIAAVAAVKGGGMGNEDIYALMLLYPAFQLLGSFPHLLVAVLISTQLTFTAAKTRDAQTLILDHLAVYVHAALGRLMEIRGIMIAVYIEQRGGDHGDKITEIGCFQITAGYYNIHTFKYSRVEVIPYELAFEIGNSQYLYLLHRLFGAYHANYSYYNTSVPISQHSVVIFVCAQGNQGSALALSAKKSKNI